MLKKLFVSASLISIFALSACERKTEEPEPIIRSVATQTITEVTDYQLREFAGQLTPGDQIDLTLEVSGTLEEVDLEVGQYVTKGEVLTRLDPATYELQVESQKANVIAAEASLLQAQNDYARQQQLADQKLVSQSVLESAKAGADTAAAQLDIAKKQLEIAEENLKKTRLIAPYDGVISLVSKKSYSQLAIGEAVATIYREGVLEVNFVVPAIVADEIHLDQEVELWISGEPHIRYKGHISELGRLANQVAAFPVVVQINENLEGLRAGEAVRVELKVPLSNYLHGYVIPTSAIVDSIAERSITSPTASSNDISYSANVFLFDPETSTVLKAPVRIIGMRDNNVIISNGLNPGDIIVTAGANLLYEGIKVKLLNSNSAEKPEE